MRHDFYNVVSCITFVHKALIDVFIVMFECEWFKIIFSRTVFRFNEVLPITEESYDTVRQCT